MFTEFFSTYNITLLLLALVFLTILKYFSKSEIAFFSLSTDEVNDMSKEKAEKEKAAIKLISTPQYLLATFIIVKNIFLALYLLFSSALIYSLSADFDSKILFFIVAISLVVLLLLCAKLTGKLSGAKKAKTTVLKNSTITLAVQNTLHPFVRLLGNSSILEENRLTKWNLSLISTDELSEALDLTDEQQEKDIEMIEGVIKFGNIPVADIMTPRADMAFIDINYSFKTLIYQINELGYSRMPVYSSYKDNVKGILFIKDLLPHLEKPETFRWQTLIRQAYYVPETKKIDDLLNEFQANRIHLALVVDEHGRISGLVSLEDIIEEIVGDISDEYDADETLFEKLDENNYILEAKIELEDFCELIGAEKEEFAESISDVDTLAGLILEIKGEMPVKSEIIRFGKYTFEILAVDKRRINKVKLSIENGAEHVKNEDEE